MRILVDPELCEANGVCVSLAPELFELGDGHTVRVLMPTPAEALRATVEEAVAGCPRAAIRIDDN